MNLKEIEERKASILVDMEKPDADIDALTVEARSLNEEATKINEVQEKRSALLAAAAAGKGVVVETQKEERKMNEVKFTPESAEYRSAYLRNLQGKELNVEERAAITATAAIPTVTLNKIVEKLEQVSVLFPFITVSHLTGNVSIPVENAKSDAAWVVMGTATTEGSDSLVAVTLSAYKLIKTIEIGADNLASSIDAFEAYISDALAKKMARAIDVAIANGTGSSQATGLLLAGQITNTGTYTKAAMVHADLMKIIASIGAEYRKNAKFVMPSAVFFSDVVPALAAKGLGVDAQSELRYQVAGYPVILNDNFAADTILFGDLSYYHFNFAQDITISADLSVGFRTGSVVYRAMALCDGKPLLAEAFAKYTRAAA